MDTKVIAAMSGGVDSSVTAALMVEAGYDVVAITMRLGTHDTIEIESDKPNCCSLEGVEDARRVATQLGIPFYAVNYEERFRQSIVDYFADEYVSGRTPSPCVICNQDLKFGKLLELATQLGVDYVATDITPESSACRRQVAISYAKGLILVKISLTSYSR